MTIREIIWTYTDEEESAKSERQQAQITQAATAIKKQLLEILPTETPTTENPIESARIVGWNRAICAMRQKMEAL